MARDHTWATIADLQRKLTGKLFNSAKVRLVRRKDAWGRKTWVKRASNSFVINTRDMDRGGNAELYCPGPNITIPRQFTDAMTPAEKEAFKKDGWMHGAASKGLLREIDKYISKLGGDFPLSVLNKNQRTTDPQQLKRQAKFQQEMEEAEQMLREQRQNAQRSPPQPLDQEDEENIEQLKDPNNPGGQSRGGYGGKSFDSNKEALEAKKQVPRDVAELSRALRRLICSMDFGDDLESPRISAKKLVKELTTKRYALGKIRRVEISRKPPVLFVDTSGSCSDFCNKWIAAAKLIQEHHIPDLVIVGHSNGYFEEFHGTQTLVGATKGDGSGRERSRIADFKTQCSGYVCFGDSDAENDYKALAEYSAQTFWLDFHDRPDKRFAGRYIGKIQNVKSAAIGLRFLAKKK